MRIAGWFDQVTSWSNSADWGSRTGKSDQLAKRLSIGLTVVEFPKLPTGFSVCQRTEMDALVVEFVSEHWTRMLGVKSRTIFCGTQKELVATISADNLDYTSTVVFLAFS